MRETGASNEPPTLLDIADELYASPLAAFTPARDARAKELRGSDRALSDRVKALRKPSLAAWVVNVLVRRQPDQVAEILTLGEALREAATVLDGDELRALTRQRRQLTAAVTTQARKIAAAEGTRVTEAVAEQVQATLTSALLDPVAAAIVRSGLLIAPVTATGVDPIDVPAVLSVPEAIGHVAQAREPAQAAETGGQTERGTKLRLVPDPDAQVKAVAAARERVEEAEAEVLAARRAVDGVQAEIAELTAQGLQIQAELDELRRRTSTLEDRAETVDDELADLHDNQADATREVEHATRQLVAAKAALEKLDRR